MTLLDTSITTNCVIAGVTTVLSVPLFYFYLIKSNLFEYKFIHSSGYFLVILHSLAFILTQFNQIEFITHMKTNFTFIMCQIQGGIHFISILSFLMFTLVNNTIFYLETIRQQKMMNQNLVFTLSLACLFIPFAIVVLYIICGIHFEISDDKSCFLLSFRGLTIFVSLFLFFYLCNLFLCIYFLYNIYSKKTLFKELKTLDIISNFVILVTMAFLLIDCVGSLFEHRGGDHWHFNAFVFIRDLFECLTGLALIISFQIKDDWKGIMWIVCQTKKKVSDQRFDEIVDY